MTKKPTLTERVNKAVKKHIYEGKVCCKDEDTMLTEIIMLEIRNFNKENTN